MSIEVEGTDYLFDRYAFLGIERTADAAAIAGAIRKKKVENHPDLYMKASEEARELTAQLWDLTERCEAVLTDPVKRATFDARLRYFTDKKPELISPNADIPTSDNHTFVSVNHLLSDVNPRIMEKIEGAAGSIGFHARQLDIMERMYREQPDDLELRDAYRQSIAAGLMYYGILEDGVWGQTGVRLGLHDKQTMMTHVSQFQAATQATIQRVADSIEGRVHDQLGLLTSGLSVPQMLLPGPDGALTPAESPQQALAASAVIVDTARENLKERTHRLAALAEKRQMLVEKLLDTMQIWPINADPQAKGYPQVCVMSDYQDGATMRCIRNFRFGGETGIEYGDRALIGKSLDELKAACGDTPTIAIEAHDELMDWPMYATFAAEKFKGIAAQSRG